MGIYSEHVIGVKTVYTTVNGKSVVKQQQEFKKLADGTQQVTTRTRDLSVANSRLKTTGKEVMSGFQRFQMEQLGVMFGGMALNRAMSNLNSTSREWLGIGDIMSTMMGITMLDANLDLLNFGVLPLFDALTNLPEGAQKAIGAVSFALEGLGAVMMTGGQLMLGLDATANLLSKITGVPHNLIFSQQGLTGIMNELKGAEDSLLRIGKYAGAGILIGVALKDLGEGQVTAAVGDAFMAAGLIRGGKVGGAMFIIGVGLKLIGDEEFRKDIANLILTVIDSLLAFGESIGNMIVGLFTGKKIDLGDFEFIGNLQEVAAEKAAAGEFKSSLFQSSASTFGSRAVGGNISQTGPYMLHEGERVLRKDQVGSQPEINVTYNVNVSDKREFEIMLRKNNSQLTQDVRRMIKS